MTKYLFQSALGHFALVILTFISAATWWQKEENLKQINLQLIQASVRVDMVAMPVATLKELKEIKEVNKMEVEVPSKNSPEASRETAPPPSAIDRSDFLSKLKKISKTKVNSNPPTSKATEDNRNFRDHLMKVALAGNKISMGTQATSAEQSKQALSAFQAYASQMPDLIRPNWALPSYLLQKKLKCRVRIWLYKNGRLMKAEIYQSSGDSEYDRRAIEAITQSAPFKALDDSFAKRGEEGELLLGFPL